MAPQVLLFGVRPPPGPQEAPQEAPQAPVEAPQAPQGPVEAPKAARAHRRAAEAATREAARAAEAAAAEAAAEAARVAAAAAVAAPPAAPALDLARLDAGQGPRRRRSAKMSPPPLAAKPTPPKGPPDPSSDRPKGKANNPTPGKRPGEKDELPELRDQARPDVAGKPTPPWYSMGDSDYRDLRISPHAPRHALALRAGSRRLDLDGVPGCHPSTAKLVLLVYIERQDAAGLAFPSVATVAGQCGASDRAVQRALRVLEAAGHIRQYDGAGAHQDGPRPWHGRSTCYQLAPLWRRQAALTPGGGS